MATNTRRSRSPDARSYLAIWVIEQFVMPIPPKVKQGVWVIVLLLALIALLTVLAGGGLGTLHAPFR